MRCLGKGRKQRHHPADCRDRRGPARPGCPNAPAAHPTRCSRPAPARALSRDAIEHRITSTPRAGGHLPVTEGQEGHRTHPAAHRRDAPAACRGRHHGDRSLAWARAGHHHARSTCTPTCPRRNERSRALHTTRHNTRPLPSPRHPARLPRSPLIMPTSMALLACDTRPPVATSA